MNSYYGDKIETLKEIFGSENIRLEEDQIIVDQVVYPIIEDVIVLLQPDQYPHGLREKMGSFGKLNPGISIKLDQAIQFSFGEEWGKYPDILPENEIEFKHYFDLIDLESLKDLRVCDLGCGNGRWSSFLKNSCRELILIDFSDSIFVARSNLRDWDRCLFFMGDLTQIPFRNGFADFLFCLGVLHHLTVNCLEVTRNLKKYSPILLIYLYYSLDNRPFYFPLLLKIVTRLRMMVSKVKHRHFRSCFTWVVGTVLYLPLVGLGRIFDLWGSAKYIPLYETYKGKSFLRIRQDVYDRFFTTIEQRCSKKEIEMLKDTFSRVTISEQIPYWHFVCRR